MKSQFEAFAHYNRWANQRLYETAAALSEAQLTQDRGAFFGSVFGTLNHILTADRIWLHRITKTGPNPASLDERQCDDFAELRAVRDIEDQRFLQAVEDLDDRRLAEMLVYRNMRGERQEQPFGQVLSHIFNHQTHHRGQAHTLLTQAGLSVPPLDFIYFLRGWL